MTATKLKSLSYLLFFLASFAQLQAQKMLLACPELVGVSYLRINIDPQLANKATIQYQGAIDEEFSPVKIYSVKSLGPDEYEWKIDYVREQSTLRLTKAEGVQVVWKGYTCRYGQELPFKATSSDTELRLYIYNDKKADLVIKGKDQMETTFNIEAFNIQELKGSKTATFEAFEEMDFENETPATVKIANKNDNLEISFTLEGTTTVFKPNKAAVKQ